MREYVTSNNISFITESELYRVYIDGAPVFAHEARVSARPVNQVWRGYQRPISQTEPVAFVSFDMDKPVSVSVRCNFEVFNAFVRPGASGVSGSSGASGIAARREGDKIYFCLDKPGNYTLDVNGAHNALHIFANPVADKPAAADPAAANIAADKLAAANPAAGVTYYGPGIHRTGVIYAESGQTIYIDEGAVLYGAIVVREREDVRICGRGIIDGSRFHRETQHNILLIEGSRRVTVDGIVLRDAPTYALSAVACEDLTINNVKVIGQWRYNADGIDLHNTRRAVISNCFVRTFDDCIVLKSRNEYGGYEAGGICMENILVEKCTIWNDWGRALEIGAETVGAYMRDIVFRDCDVMHFLFIACDIQACGDAEIYDVTFENIRVGEPLDPACEPRLIEIFIWPMCWVAVEKLGNVHNVIFRDILYNGRTSVPCRFIGYAADCDIKDVALERVTVNGKQLEAGGIDMSPIIINGYVSGLTVDGAAVSADRVHFEDGDETNDAFLIGNGAFIKFE